ncbi:MAG TPA: ATP-grasp domain-containing protein [Methylomirabilota bacterium]|nr:ATP-grasp domain-containing protein [Methylomirabilota bacterium]
MHCAPAKRLLLLIPTTTYRTEDFMDAARRLDVDLVVAAERPNVMAGEFPDHLLTVPFDDPERAARELAEYARRRPIDAVVPVDDETTLVGAAIAARLGLRCNPVGAVAAARNKRLMRERLAKAGLPGPVFTSVSVHEDPAAVARRMTYPCVLKPLVLSASRGVIRADDPAAFVAAFQRVRAILAEPDVAALGDGTDQILVEAFVPGVEVALEGLLIAGTLSVLALFDKPDPLDGPYFEETIYVTPSRLPATTQRAIADVTAQAARALGLEDGPIHAELRLDPRAASDAPRPVMLELAARSIGGLCSRTLRFGTGLTLEDLILRRALDLPIASLEREGRAAGVMMIPIRRAGVLEKVEGLDAAEAMPLIEDVTISAHPGETLVPLPEGHRYLGFIFARGDDPAAVERALRDAHARLTFTLR